MKATSLLFFSSSPLSLPLLGVLLKGERFEFVGLVCQPDKAAGRKGELLAPATKALALKHGIPVYQPEKLSKAVELLKQLEENRPDFLLTFAYGQLLSEEWLKLPRREALNVHPSLLPKYRGPTPPQAALLHGDTETGITLMRMVKEMDAGPIAMQHAFPLREITTGELFEEVAKRAAEWIPEDLATIAAEDGFAFVEQDADAATYCEKFTKEDTFEDFQKTAEVLLNRYRAFTPWPGLWTTYKGKRLKFLALKSSGRKVATGTVDVEGERLFTGTQSQAVEILTLQMEGKSALSAAEFLRGHPDFTNAVLPS
jgi:methionyl-tRNA formyltransferase